MKIINNSISHMVFIGMILLFSGTCCAEWAVSNAERCWNCYNGPNCAATPTDEVPLFGKFYNVYIGQSCSSLVLPGCACECFIPEDCFYYKVSLPDYLGSSYSIHWGQQGSDVVICGCGSVFRAKASIGKLFSSDRLVQYFSGTCNDHTEEKYHIATRQDNHYFMAVFDPNVFIVNNQTKSPVLLGGSVEVDLVNADCQTLEKAKDAKVRIYHQKSQEVLIHSVDCDPLDTELIHPFRRSLTSPELVETVGVKFIPEDIFDTKCANPEIPGSSPPSDTMTAGTSCSSCSGSGSGLGELIMKNGSVNIAFGEEETLPFYGSPGFTYDGYGVVNGASATPEINAPGGWVRAEHYPYQRNNVVYDPILNQAEDTILRIDYSFDVNVYGGNTYHYSFTKTGPWVDEYFTPGVPSSGIKKYKEQVALEAFYADANGRILLTHVTDQDNNTILQYDYSGEDPVQISKAVSGNPIGYIFFDMEDSSLVRVWAGEDDEDFVERSQEPIEPESGRWIDVDYTVTASDGKKFLSKITHGGCDSCKASRTYEYGGPNNNQITEIKKADGTTILASYTYDPQGRFESYNLGSGEDEKKVSEWRRSDYDPAAPETSGDNMLIRRDYVNNSKYRAKIYFSDDRGALIKEIHYHQLQDNPDKLKGPYSVYRYYYQSHDEEGTVNDWKRYVTSYPRGNKLYQYYDYCDGEDHGNVIKVAWSHDISHPEMEYTYGLYQYDGDSRYMIESEINANGGVTEYEYYANSAFQLKTQTEPTPGEGVLNATQEQQVTTYVYDDQQRVDYEYKKDSDGDSVYTKYVYDDLGNMIRLHENCTDCLNPDLTSNPNPSTGLVTTYDYNVYNQLVTTTYPSRRVEKNFYSESGTVIAEAVYEDYNNELAVNATMYTYIDGKLEIKKTAKMNTSFTFNEATVNSGGSGITWVQEKYIYDDYGRRIKVISDYGDGCQNLTTEYEFNNQGEVTCILQPDQRYKRTVRDGRGLITEEIAGVFINNEEVAKATTKYFYDLNGNLIRKEDPEGVTEIYQYDLKDRRIQVRHVK